MIRKAKHEDLDDLMAIYQQVKLDRSKLDDQEYETEIQKRGFLLGLDTPETFLKQIDIAYEFLVNEREGKILGYLIADHREEEKFHDDKYKTWFDSKLKDFYYHDPMGMTIASIACIPEESRKGIATGLLKFLENRLKKEKYQYLFSIVTLAPITNCPTIVWHAKNGFKRLAMGKPRRLFDLDNYSGVLLHKNLA